MSNIVVNFYRKEYNKFVVVRTEMCDNVFEADSVIEGEDGHYDKVTIEDLTESK